MNATRQPYTARIAALYERECYGEHLFSLLAAREADLGDARRAAVWRRVADVERATAACARPLAESTGADLEQLARLSQSRARDQLDAFADMSWREILEHYAARMPESLRAIRAFRDEALPAHARALAQFVAHSEAFDACVDQCLAGDLEAGIEALDEYLGSQARSQ